MFIRHRGGFAAHAPDGPDTSTGCVAIAYRAVIELIGKCRVERPVLEELCAVLVWPPAE